MKKHAVLDGNEAVAQVAYRLNEVIAIYPITPSSAMGEWADQWASEKIPNLWGSVPSVIEMQSEGGAAGCVHGALQTGALTTTFTASQGLLLMIPNMYKIAGELTSCVFHVASRAVATHALSIFGDHSDVMAARATGWAMLSSASVQEAMDFALISQAATLESRIPFLHFMDGFRTSHEVAKVELLSESDMRGLIDDFHVQMHRGRALNPEHPVVRGTAQNPDVFFQSREASNPFYAACPDIVQSVMDRFARLTGRSYRLFEYSGAPDAERVIVLMGSGCEAAEETVRQLSERGERVGLLKVRLFRPFDSRRFVEALPPTARSIAVLDRTKEPGSPGEPLYLDCGAALREGLAAGWGELASAPRLIGGRYGLSSKEFTPAMIRGIFDHLEEGELKTHFTVGIADDVSQTSLPYDPRFSTESADTVRCVFYGLGSDGTVGANKNSIKIIGEETDRHVQAYFVYDSKKSGAVTISHLRFGPKPIHSTYLIERASFVACHHQSLLEHFDVLETLESGGTFLLNTIHGPAEIWARLPEGTRTQLAMKRAKFYVIDAGKVARESGLGGRINTVMQVAFFALSEVLDRESALEAIRTATRKAYEKKGEEIVRKNLLAIDSALAQLTAVELPEGATFDIAPPPRSIPESAPEFVRNVTATMLAGRGDSLPVSAMPPDGTFPNGTSRWEKRNLAQEIPVWESDLCIQCGKCSMVCPHAAIRIKAYEPSLLANAPSTFKSSASHDKEWKELSYTIQVAPEDCTGCTLCVDICPAREKGGSGLKALHMKPQPPLREAERANWEFFLKIPELDRRRIKPGSIRQQQVEQPLFEFSGACTGCGETPYVKLLTQLFGDRLLIANATGCSSIFGGNLPTTPYTRNAAGRGPAWANSLFEDNAEFGLGFRVSIDKQREFACELLRQLSPSLGEARVAEIADADQRDEAGIHEQRERVARLKSELEGMGTAQAQQLLSLADTLVRRSVWIVGGDGWAYDIGFGGLDHVLASGRNVKVLVLDTEVYSNTGGQASKSTPRGAVAKFASGGKPGRKKDLGLMAMTYGNVYVAQVAMGAKDEQTLKAFLEAEAYEGPALIIAYSHCIAHGFDISAGLQHHRAAVDSGEWMLYRYNPDRGEKGDNPLLLDSRAPTMQVAQFMEMENRFRSLAQSHPEEARLLRETAQRDVVDRRALYEYFAARTPGPKPSA